MPPVLPPTRPKTKSRCNMAVLPSFTPAQPPDTIARIGMEADNQQQNWMTQAASRKQMAASTEQTQAQTAQMRAALPALIAKHAADAASSQNDLDAALAAQTARASFQTMKPQVIQDIMDVEDPMNHAKTEDGTPDWVDKYQQYEKLQAKYAALELFPEGKQFYSMLEERKKNAFTMAMQHSQAQNALDRMNAQVAGRLEGIGMTVAGREATNARTNDTREKVAETQAGARVTAAETNQAGALNRTRINDYSRAANDYENMAAKETDPVKARQWLAKAQEFRAKADEIAAPEAPSASVSLPATGAAPAAESRPVEDENSPASEAPDAGETGSLGPAPVIPQVSTSKQDSTSAKPNAAKAPVAPTTVSKKDISAKNGVITLKVGDKDVPLHRDAKGNTAYFLGGVWHEVKLDDSI